MSIISQPCTTLVELLQHQASIRPEKIVYRFLRNGEQETASWRYSQLHHQAQLIAGFLQQTGQSGDRVALMLSPGLDYIAAFFGCLYADRIAVPTYPPANRKRDGKKVAALLEDAKPIQILTSGKEHDRLVQTLDGTVWSDTVVNLADIPADAHKQWQQPGVTSDSIAFLQYTSGSTGTPKGVMVSHGNLINNTHHICNETGITTDDTIVSWLPPYHDMGLIGGLLATIYGGMTSVLMEPVAFLQQPFRWLKAISDYKAAATAAPNFAYQLAVDKISDEQLQQLDLSSLNLSLSGAEPVRPQTVNDFTAKFSQAGLKPDAVFPAYGMAEFTLFTSGSRPVINQFDEQALTQHTAKKVTADSQTTAHRSLVSCGPIIPQHQLIIVQPESLAVLADGQVGEIWLQGPSVAQGYWNRPELTEQQFHAVATKDGEPLPGHWLRTGDLGFLDEGNVYVTGRQKDLIILRGRNLYPQDLERVATATHDDLLTDGCAAFSIEQNNEEKLVLVMEVSRHGLKRLNYDDAASLVRQSLSQEFSTTVADIVFIKPATLPRTSSGKIQRSATKIRYQDNDLSIVGQVSQQSSSSESTPTISIPHHTLFPLMAEAISKQLNIPSARIQPDTSFADLGLDSVSAVNLAATLSEKTGEQLDPVALWDYPTPADLCRYLTNDNTTNNRTMPAQSMQKRHVEPIAVVGMGLQVPSAHADDIDDIDAFWAMLNRGDDVIGPLPESRHADFDGLDNARTIPQGGFLKSVDTFDASFFDMSAREAACLDPQQRLLLQVSWRALENAGLSQQDIAARTAGVFVGMSTDDYAPMALNSEQMDSDAGYLGLGTARSVAAGRLAYFLGCKGPALALDTACSSSSYAIHLACQSLSRGESDIALCGGVNLMLSQHGFTALDDLNALSPDYRCKTFSDEANGYVRGEGCGMLVLKPLSQAEKDGDHIYGTIAASVANQDGHSNGLTAPNGSQQRALLQQALSVSGISANEIGYIETHGTGTPLGDPIEVNAIADAFQASNTSREQPILLGALKSQLGHLEAAAGVLAVIKTLLCVQRQHIPANLYNGTPNRHIDWQSKAVQPVAEAQTWPVIQHKPAVAGVSAFGLSGTNVHFTIQAAPTQQPLKQTPAVLPFVALSGKSKAAVLTKAQQLNKRLEQHDYTAAELTALCSATQSQQHFSWRSSLLAKDATSLQAQLNSLSADYIHREPVDKQPLVFMFTGQGSIYAEMGQALYTHSDTFKASIDRAALWVKQQQPDTELTELLFNTANEAELLQPRFAQFSLYVLQVALVDVFKAIQLTPDAVIGHSIGEFAAAYTAGVITAEQGYTLTWHRGLLTESCKAGHMLAVSLNETQTRDTLAKFAKTSANSLDIAAINHPKQTVVAGDIATINNFSDYLTAEGIKNKVLATSHAFHSSLMESMQPAFADITDRQICKAARINWYSTLTGQQLTSAPDTAYWRDHIRHPVRFATALDALLNDLPNATLVELGPHPILTAIAKQQVTSFKQVSVNATLKRNSDDIQQMARTLGQLWQSGFPVDLRQLPQLPRVQRPALPGYPFARKRHWITAKKPQLAAKAPAFDVNMLDSMVDSYDWSDAEKAVLPELMAKLKSQLTAQLGQLTDHQTTEQITSLIQTQQWQPLTLNTRATTADNVVIAWSGTRPTTLLNTFEQAGVNMTSVCISDGTQPLAQSLQAMAQQSVTLIVALQPHEAATYELDTLHQLAAQAISDLQTLFALTGSMSNVDCWLTVDSMTQTNCYQASLQGSARSLIHEFPDHLRGVVDVSLSSPTSVQPFVSLISSAVQHTEFRLTDGAVLGRELAGTDTVVEQAADFTNKHLMITGGTGALGLMLTRYLAEKGASKITLINRRASAFDQLTAPQQRQLNQAMATGCHVQLEKLDINQADQVAEFFNDDTLELDGIFHLAGKSADTQQLADITEEVSLQVLQPKTAGAWLLHHYSQSQPLQWFVCFSSVAALMGYAGQTTYSAANFELDHLAQQRLRQGLPALSINWGPWQGDGMAASTLVDKAMAQLGIQQLIEQDAFDAMSLSMGMKHATVSIIAADWEKAAQRYSSRFTHGLLRGFLPHSDLDTDEHTLSVADQLKAMTTDDRQQAIQQWLIHTTAEALGDTPDESALHEPLNRLGMDSIRALELKHAVQQHTGIDVPVVKFLEGISLLALTEQLTQAMDSEQPATSSALTITPGLAENPAPLSYAQQRLWLVNQWQKPDGLYNIHAAIKVTGQLDTERLQGVVDGLVARHEVLRTRFIEADEGAVQRIDDNQFIPVKVHEITTALDSELAEDKVRQLAHQIFNLETGPLLAVDVIRSTAAADQAIISLTLDHIIADAWSMDVLIRDFIQLYTQPQATPDALDIQYRDYAAWQRETLNDDAIKQLSQFWQPTLSGMKPFEYKTDLPRPARQDLTGRCHRFSLSAEASTKLQQLADQQGVTLFVLLLTLFKLFMHHKTGENDIAIGTDVANREELETRNLIGFFVNLLLLRSQFEQNPSFGDMLHAEKDVVHQALAHQDMPFHKLVELMKTPRDASRNPLIQVLFVLQNAQSETLTLPDLTVEQLDIDEQVCRFDMALFFKQKDGQLQGYWHYAKALYNPDTINQLSQEFCHLIQGVLTNPEQSLEEIRMLDLTKDNQTTDTSNGPATSKRSKKKASFNRFKSKKAAAPVTPTALVEKFPYQEGKAMPLIVKAANKDLDPFGWAEMEREAILADLQKHGAILFRDFPLKDATDFERFSRTICPSLYGEYGDLPKEKKGEKIYHSTPYPIDKSILYHNESSHMNKWPTRQFFFCVQPSPIGGATPIVDCREVYKELDPAIREEFENKHLCYVRNFSRNLDVSWQNFFKTEDKAVVEEKCRKAGIEFQWMPDDGLRTKEIRRAVAIHPESGEKSFFNQIQLHHSAFLAPEVRESLLALMGQEGLPRHVYFGDGSEISDEVAKYTYDLYEKLAVRFDWQKGDLVMVDNMVVAHARDPFQGERKINVALAEMVEQQGTVVPGISLEDSLKDPQAEA